MDFKQLGKNYLADISSTMSEGLNTMF